MDQKEKDLFINKIKQQLQSILKDLNFPPEEIKKQLDQLNRLIYLLVLQEELNKLAKDERDDVESTVQKIKDNVEASTALLNYLTSKVKKDQIQIDFKNILIKTLKNYLEAVISSLKFEEKSNYYIRIESLLKDIENLPHNSIMTWKEFEEKIKQPN